MRQFVKASLATIVLGSALLFAGTVTAGIASTKHNLGSEATAPGPNNTAATGEICIFCHTPHGGDTGAAVPLWNKVLTDETNFQTYDELGTSTLDAGILTNVGSVSLACLTCHDGSQAIDNILNGPGSGDYDATGGGTGGRLAADGWSWTSTDSSLDATGTFVGGAIFNLGKDLRNDHPIGVQYGGGGVSLGVTSTNDEDFVAPVQVGANARWYVDNTVQGTAGDGFDKWDFKLYTRDTSSETFNATTGQPTSTANGLEPFVECGSCHDPHFETTTFLRMPGVVDISGGGQESNAGSRVCLTCHTK